ncbi:uncharacterized protein [Rutidosis leptorrhynchoides]|uniref:uncharacterized protein n=1 Tax=Rutidosis leptorrhynchoides TaxID=125765 RepID=UPI003A99F8AE
MVMDRLIKCNEMGDWSANFSWCRTPSGRTNGELNELLSILHGFKFSSTLPDSWPWFLNNDGRFVVSTLNSLINSELLPTIVSPKETMRNSFIPQHLGIFVWRVKRNRLPVLSELDRRGVDLDSILCPICKNDIETVDHTLLLCPFAADVWSRVCRWWNCFSSSFVSFDELFVGTSHSLIPNKYSKLWQAVEWITGYMIWKHRNDLVFKKKRSIGPMLVSEIQLKAYEWISNRSRKPSLNWSQWLINPNSFDDHG